MLLNTPGGTYYLPEGLDGWKPTDPGDLMTKVTAVVPNDEGKQLGKMPYSFSSAVTRA